MIRARAIATAWGDEDFAARLKRDPHGVILEQFGYILSPNFELEIVDGADAGSLELWGRPRLCSLTPICVYRG